MSSKSFLIRLMVGLLIATPAAYMFSTHPTEESAQIPSVRDGEYSVSSLCDSLVQAALESETAEDQAVLRELAQTFQPLKAELLWSGSVPLGLKGLATYENVRLAAEAVDFTVVYPHETFTFNGVVGVRSEEKGYRPGLMYSGGEVVTGIGGGICMLATMLYEGALKTGMRIIERHPHSGPVSYAEPGLDSAVSYGWADLRFKNDTGHLVLVRAKVTEDRLEVSFYGTADPNRRIEIVAEDYEEIPYRIFEVEDETVPDGEVVVKQAARTGYRVTIVRLVSEGKTPAKREVMSRDTMLPRHKIVLLPPSKHDDFQPVAELDEKPHKRGYDGISEVPDPKMPEPVTALSEPTDEVLSQPRVHGQISLEE